MCLVSVVPLSTIYARQTSYFLQNEHYHEFESRHSALCRAVTGLFDVFEYNGYLVAIVISGHNMSGKVVQGVAYRSF